jgi:diacylglycerol kinase (ATP)
MINHHRLRKSFGFAVEGIMYTLKHDQNILVHLLFAIFVIIASLILGLDHVEVSVLGIAILFVIIAEMLNTAIEKTVDLITTEHRIEAKIAKDVSSGMVLVAAIGAALLGLFIFLPKIVELLW